MKVTDILHRRQQNWQELARLTTRLESTRRSKIAAAEVARFASLYRAACADLALADAYQLPPNMVQYLHRLVGRAHNQLYRARRFDYASWRKTLLETVPQKIFQDRCVQLSFLLFWGFFLFCGALAYFDRSFAERLVGPSTLDMMQDMHGNRTGGSPIVSPMATAFYIWHNTGIGLKCFAGGLLVLPGIAINVFNAGYLGTVFGFMAGHADEKTSDNFFNFVTAHGPFELTAIVISAGAGLRLGMAWIIGDKRYTIDTLLGTESEDRPRSALQSATTVVLNRVAALILTARDAMPTMGAAMLMFFMAAMIEGFVSPSVLPYGVKAGIAIASSAFLIFYFVILGYPRKLL